MLLTQIEFDEIKRQVRYEPETGEFFYKEDRWLERKFPTDDPQKVRVVPQPKKKAHNAGDRADKIYSGKYVGVYVLGKVLNAAHLALYFITGHWPEAVKYRNHTWDDLRAANLEPITRSQQATEAANARYEGQERGLPKNIYVTSNGKFIARVGDKTTKPYESVREAVQAKEKGRWL